MVNIDIIALAKEAGVVIPAGIFSLEELQVLLEAEIRKEYEERLKQLESDCNTQSLDIADLTEQNAKLLEALKAAYKSIAALTPQEVKE